MENYAVYLMRYASERCWKAPTEKQKKETVLLWTAAVWSRSEEAKYYEFGSERPAMASEGLFEGMFFVSWSSIRCFQYGF